ncbi:MAG TPA: Kdo hydroxylase family protein [Vicinamibacterales bacterium]|nr:Kdo hydroxylase family protein [Vicinamibacterales bacterium]
MSLYQILTPSFPSDSADRLEEGDVIVLPHFDVAIEADERELFTPAILASAKNVSLAPGSGRVSGTTLRGTAAERLIRLMQRFSDAAARLVEGLCPQYAGRIVRARASFRPAEIAGRPTSWRKDDTRLHVDSFPATPSGGQRILRVFTNVNPDGRPRVWRIGGAFDAVASRFAPALRMPLPGSGVLLALLRITKTPRTPYDALMLQLHDRMKQDAAFQASSPQTEIPFAAGTTWLCFTDEVSHAAMSGQFQLEQTFLLPVAAMRRPERSPLRILERITGRRLA